MNNFSYKMMFFLFLMIGSLITISSSTWFMAWLGMEINIMAFIPLIANMTSLSSEATLKYFLIQTMGSIIMLFSASLILLFKGLSSIETMYLFPTNMMIECAMLMKLGAAPFHLWFPQIIEGMSWTMVTLLLTWQKIAPISLLMMTSNTFIIWLSVLASAVVGSVGGLNQLSIRKIITYSSINHMSWMVCALITSVSIFIFYFIVYSMISITIMMLMKLWKLYFISQLFTGMKNLLPNKMIISFLLFSLGGLPPFLGFFPKWMVLNKMLLWPFTLIPLIMIFTTLITLLYYTRVSYSMLLLNSFFKKINSISMITKPHLSTSIILLTSLSFFPIMILIPY